MKRSLGGFGLVMLVIVVAIVLILAARQWQAVAPVAAEIPASAGDTGESSDDDGRPGLREMRANTSEHSDRVQDALAATD